MTPTAQDCASLQQWGFSWVKDGVTDKVTPEGVTAVSPRPGGLEVVYTPDSALDRSLAEISDMEYPEDLENKWIRVTWTRIEDLGPKTRELRRL